MTSYATRALVTGAGGFIGSHLVERLVTDGVRVRALVHYNSRNDWGSLDLVPKDVLAGVEVIAGDIRDPFCVDNAVAGCDVLFHLSSLIGIPYSYVAPESYVATNVMGVVNLLEAARKHAVRRVVHTSTSECYGTARYAPIDEEHPLQPQSPYAASKIGADMIADSYWRSFGVPVVTLRPFNTYGPRQSARAVIPTIIAQALQGPVIRLGSLAPTRDMNYVTDTVDGFIRAAQIAGALGQVINVGSGREISIGQLAQLILGIMGSSTPVVDDEERVRPQRSEVMRLACNADRARTLLGWSPRFTLEEGLARTVEWFRAHASRYKTTIYNI